MIEFLIWFVASFISTFGITYLYYKISFAHTKINLKIVIVFMCGVIFLSLIKFYNLNNLNIFAYFLFYPFLFYVINPIKLKSLYCTF